MDKIEKSFELIAKYSINNRDLIQFGIIIGLLAIAFFSASHQIPIISRSGNITYNNTYINNTINGTNFSINITGQPQLLNFATLISGSNISMVEDTANHTITIFSTGGGSGSNITLPICNPANQAVTSDGNTLSCVSIADDDSAYIPYTGATGNVDLGTYDISTNNVNTNDIHVNSPYPATINISDFIRLNRTGANEIKSRYEHNIITELDSPTGGYWNISSSDGVSLASDLLITPAGTGFINGYGIGFFFDGIGISWFGLPITTSDLTYLCYDSGSTYMYYRNSPCSIIPESDITGLIPDLSGKENKSDAVNKTDYNGDFPNNTITANNLVNWNATYNVTYDALNVTVNGNLVNWNLTYNATYNASVASITQLQQNDTADRAFVNNTFLPNSTYNGNFPNSTITANNLVNWNNTFNSTYDTLNVTVNGNLANWNSTYNATYNASTVAIVQLQINDTTDRAYVNNTFEPKISTGLVTQFWNGLKQFVSITISNVVGLQTFYDAFNVTQTIVNGNLVNWNSTYNSTYDSNNNTIAGNLANWNNTYNASYNASLASIIQLQINDTTSQIYVNNTFLPNSTYNGNFPNLTLESMSITWNQTTTIVNGNLANWNNTYNSTYDNYQNTMNAMNNSNAANRTYFQALSDLNNLTHTYFNLTFAQQVLTNTFFNNSIATKADAIFLNITALPLKADALFTNNSLTGLINNDTLDRAYVNSTFLKQANISKCTGTDKLTTSDGLILTCATDQTGAGGTVTPEASFVYSSNAVTMATNASIMDVFNAVGSGKIIRITHITTFVNDSVAVTGITAPVEIIRTNTVGTGGVVVNNFTYDTADAVLPIQITARTAPAGGATITGNVLSGSRVNTEEGSIGTTFPWFISEVNIYSNNGLYPRQRLTLREGEGLLCRWSIVAGTAAGLVNCEVEFQVGSAYSNELSTYSWYANSIATANKVMMDIFNNATSRKTLKITKISIYARPVAAVTGNIIPFFAQRTLNNGTGGGDIKADKYDTTNTDTAPEITARDAPTGGALLNNGTVLIGVIGADETSNPEYGEFGSSTHGGNTLYMWDAATTQRPLTVRPGQGIAIRTGQLTAGGNVVVIVEGTVV